jgi:hypothetical protein
MTKINETASGVNNNSPQARRRTKREEKEPQTVQVIHQIIIPETPRGLVGEKVVYTEKYLKLMARYDDSCVVPLPECGYFVITKVQFRAFGVIVSLYPHPSKAKKKIKSMFLIINLLWAEVY